jgi:hypothetical protein
LIRSRSNNLPAVLPGELSHDGPTGGVEFDDVRGGAVIVRQGFSRTFEGCIQLRVSPTVGTKLEVSRSHQRCDLISSVSSNPIFRFRRIGFHRAELSSQASESPDHYGDSARAYRGRENCHYRDIDVEHLSTLGWNIGGEVLGLYTLAGVGERYRSDAVL